MGENIFIKNGQKSLKSHLQYTCIFIEYYGV